MACTLQPAVSGATALFLQGLSSIPDFALFMLNTELKVKSWTRAAELLYGYKIDEIIDKPFSEFYPQSTLDVKDPGFELKISQSIGKYNVNNLQRTKSGTIFCACERITPILNNQGDLLGYSKIIQKITYDTNNLNSRYNSPHTSLKNFLRPLFLNVNYGTWQWDVSTNSTYYDPNMYTMMGFDLHTFTGTYGEVIKTIHPEDRELVHTTVCNLVESKSETPVNADVDYRVIRPDTGAVINIHCQLTKYSESNKEFVAGFCHDVTLKIKNELDEKLKDTEIRLQGLNNLMHTLCHEIRTPLTGIQGVADWILYLKKQLLDFLSKVQSNDVLTQTNFDSFMANLQESIDINNECATYLGEVVTSILDQAKMDAGKLQLKRNRFNPKKLISSIIKRHKTNLINFGHKKNILPASTLTTRTIEVSLPQEELYVFGDISRIKIIASHLLDDLVNFNDNSIYVQLKTEECTNNSNQAMVTFTISDVEISNLNLFTEVNGIYKFDNSWENERMIQKMNLLIVKGYVDAMNGEFEIISLRENHLIYRVSLPLELSTVTDTTQKGNTNAKNKFKQPLRKHILIVDDNYINQKILSTLVKKRECTYHIASSGFEALKLIKSNTYDLIFMDVNMPKMDGLETTKQIRKIDDSVPIVGLSGNSAFEDEIAAKASGMQDYITKPYKFVEVLGKIILWTNIQ